MVDLNVSDTLSDEEASSEGLSVTCEASEDMGFFKFLEKGFESWSSSDDEE